MASKWSSSALIAAWPLFAVDRFEAVEPHMGTMAHVVVYARDEAQAKTAFAAAFARIAELDSILSDYKPQSELNQLCASQTALTSPDLFRVLEASQSLAQESAGAFDITAGPLVQIWRNARKTGKLPTNLDAALALTGYRKLTLDPATRRASLSEAGMRLDVGGVAKGYAAGEALARITQAGISRAMVALSGDIAVSHAPPGKPGWSITLELLGGTREIELADASVSTAGDTEQFVEIGGTRYSHILDPRTGMALTTPIAVSVVSPSGLEADGLDTTISVLGMQKGLELLKKHPQVWALIVTSEGATETGKRLR